MSRPASAGRLLDAAITIGDLACRLGREPDGDRRLQLGFAWSSPCPTVCG